MTLQRAASNRRMRKTLLMEPRRLAALRATRLLDTPAEIPFDGLTHLACGLFDAPIAWISLLDAHRQWFKSTCGLSLREIPIEHAFCTYVLEADTVVVIEDAQADPRFADNPYVRGEPYIRFYAGAPIYGPDRMPLGTFCIVSDSPRAFDARERETLEGLARLTTIEIGRRSARRAERQGHPLGAYQSERDAGLPSTSFGVKDCWQVPYAAKNPAHDDTALQAQLEKFRVTLDATLDLILIADEQTQRFTYCNQGAIERLGYSRDELLALSPDTLDDSLSVSALGERLAALDGQRALRLNASLACRNGEMLPVQAQIQRTPSNCLERTQLIIVARDLRETLEAQREIEWITHHDGLTHQLNRTGFLRALARGDHTADQCKVQLVAVLGIDRFKRINDAHGTAQADAILCELAQHLSSLLAPHGEAQLGRLGGDEFAISVPLAQTCDAPPLAERLREAVESHRFRAIEGLQLTVSVGLTAHSLHQTAPEELLRRANAALVRAKQHGRNRVRQYLSGMLDEASRHEAIERRLAGAFERREFHLDFQPQWSLKALDRPCGAEALLRWQAPDQSRVGPDVFVPILEQSGLMVEVGRWIIDQALDTLASNRQRLPANFFVSINISAIQLMDDTQLAVYLIEALQRRRLPASALELEITETALIQSPYWVGQQLEALHKQSIAIALDDFGTGFSSLSHLKQFPFDTVKIDKSFIAGLPGSPEDRAIVESLLTLCRGFGRNVCAEGIETPAQLDYLRRLGCNRAQGYLLARPDRDLLAYDGK
ncbi:EAL domain-containing protein [Halomonas sp. HP20-15]|uniref:sensor domain-containing phosphodiesterase n=1 Tax=Halomonas sp. HP20-15 TaxID=3085901 RepID=UPI0029817C6C|nr:EAL domain-containing protein [Halomonas sp. HP20-15]MDW5375706.1 EAL domain-containing protein [Halomonas sp. HP20-15]